MQYGGLFSLPNGETFTTPDAIPMRLRQTYDFRSSIANATARAAGFIPVDLSRSFLPVFFAWNDGNSTSQLVTCNWSPVSGGINVEGFAYGGGNTVNFTMRVYLFSMEPRSNPGGYGLAVYDAQGNLIITHEDKVLTDIQSLGDRGSQNAGTGIDVTFGGRWGYIPGIAGIQFWRSAGGGPGGTLTPINMRFGNYFDGSSTRLSSALTLAPSGQVESGANALSPMTVFNLSIYD